MMWKHTGRSAQGMLAAFRMSDVRVLLSLITLQLIVSFVQFLSFGASHTLGSSVDTSQSVLRWSEVLRMMKCSSNESVYCLTWYTTVTVHRNVVHNLHSQWVELARRYKSLWYPEMAPTLRWNGRSSKTRLVHWYIVHTLLVHMFIILHSALMQHCTLLHSRASSM